MARCKNAHCRKWQLFFHSVPFLGLQICWTIQQVFGMTYLASLGIPNRILPILIASGPWSGLLVPPIIALLFHNRCDKSWRLLTICGGIGVTTSLLCLASADSLNRYHNTTSTPGRVVAGIAMCTMNISTQPLSLALRASVVDHFQPDQQPIANLWISRFSALGSVMVTLVAYASKASFPEIAYMCSAILAFVLLLNVASVHSGSRVTSDRLLGAKCQRTVSSIFEGIRELPPLTRRTCRVQLASWFSWFFVLNYTSSLISQTFPLDSPTEKQRQISATALVFHLTALGTTLVATTLWGWDTTEHDKDPLSLSPSTKTTPQPLFRLMFTWRLCLLTLSIWLFGVFLCALSSRPEAATMLLSAIGSIFALTNWIPYALIAYEVSALQEDDQGQSTALLLAVHNTAICLPQIIASGVGWVLVAVVESLDYRFHVSLAFLACVPACLLAAYLV